MVHYRTDLWDYKPCDLSSLWPGFQLYVVSVILCETCHDSTVATEGCVKQCTQRTESSLAFQNQGFSWNDCKTHVLARNPRPRVVWNIVQRQLRRRQTCDARISFQECPGHVSVWLAWRLCTANFACQKVTHQNGCTLHVFIQTNFLLSLLLIMSVTMHRQCITSYKSVIHTTKHLSGPIWTS